MSYSKSQQEEIIRLTYANDLIAQSEAAKKLNVWPQTISRWIKAGDISTTMRNGKPMVRLSEAKYRKNTPKKKGPK